MSWVLLPGYHPVSHHVPAGFLVHNTRINPVPYYRVKRFCTDSVRFALRFPRGHDVVSHDFLDLRAYARARPKACLRPPRKMAAPSPAGGQDGDPISRRVAGRLHHTHRERSPDAGYHNLHFTILSVVSVGSNTTVSVSGVRPDC